MDSISNAFSTSPPPDVYSHDPPQQQPKKFCCDFMRFSRTTARPTPRLHMLLVILWALLLLLLVILWGHRTRNCGILYISNSIIFSSLVDSQQLPRNSSSSVFLCIAMYIHSWHCKNANNNNSSMCAMMMIERSKLARVSCIDYSEYSSILFHSIGLLITERTKH